MINYIFVFCTENYPNNFSANNTKISIIAKELSKLNNQVTIINNPKYKNKEGLLTIDNINIYNLSTDNSIKNKKKELHRIFKEKYAPEKINILITSCGSCIDHYLTLIIGKKCGYKIGYIYQEWHWVLDNSIKGRINTIINDFILIHKYNFILPISEFLIHKIEKYNIPFFKFPILDQIKDIQVNQVKSENNSYFVYCASTGYLDVIKFVIDSFKIFIEDYSEYQLKLILSGSTKSIEDIKNIIVDKGLNTNIFVHTKLPYIELKQLYQNAIGLIIPLKPDYIPECARFSQKTAEYLSTANPIITTNVGEMAYYFKHLENAYISNYSIESFANIYKEIVNNRLKAQEIGYNGYLIAKEKFNAKTIAIKLNDFFRSIFNK